MGRYVGGRTRWAVAALAVSFATGAVAAETFDQQAPITPYGVPADPAQASGDEAAVNKDNKVAPLPALPPEPAPPKFLDKTKSPKR